METNRLPRVPVVLTAQGSELLVINPDGLVSFFNVKDPRSPAGVGSK